MIIKKEIDVQGFKDYVEAIQSCGYHPLVNLTKAVMDSVTQVLDCHIEEAETYEEIESRIIVQLDDGTVGIFSEWADTSGHG